MALTIIRNDITKMAADAIVNTAGSEPRVGRGCDIAVYRAAGYDELLAYRTEHVGTVPEGEVFLTPGFALPAKHIIHAVSPLYRDGSQGEEEKLRSCYRKSLELAAAQGFRSVAFPLIATGSFGYPKEEGLRIAADEINAFLLRHEMQVYLVVFGDESVALGRKITPHLEAYIDSHYAQEKAREEYGSVQEDRRESGFRADLSAGAMPRPAASQMRPAAPVTPRPAAFAPASETADQAKAPKKKSTFLWRPKKKEEAPAPSSEPVPVVKEEEVLDFASEHESKLQERIRHMSDTFSEYLLYLIKEKGMDNAAVYKRAIVDKKVFSKIKNNPDYHPQKLTALCLCVGACLNLDETRDLLARAGYALSPSDKTDIIFAYFIENEIYDMIELDIQLEEHGLPCIIE
ncbi:MAG: macro domain-containing protein [Lachnospiraceae bacterium]|nr:macro domain-containing protein [Lachnospiraceae bacterium]